MSRGTRNSRSRAVESKMLGSFTCQPVDMLLQRAFQEGQLSRDDAALLQSGEPSLLGAKFLDGSAGRRDAGGCSGGGFLSIFPGVMCGADGLLGGLISSKSRRGVESEVFARAVVAVVIGRRLESCDGLQLRGGKTESGEWAVDVCVAVFLCASLLLGGGSDFSLGDNLVILLSRRLEGLSWERLGDGSSTWTETAE